MVKHKIGDAKHHIEEAIRDVIPKIIATGEEKVKSVGETYDEDLVKL